MNEDPATSRPGTAARGALEHRGSVLDGVPHAMPSLQRAFHLSTAAAGVGFDWPEVGGVLDKVREEFDELADALGGHGDVAHEYGDLLFALANLGRFIGVDPDTALRAANERFIRRFGFIEGSLERQGRAFREATLDEMEALWQEAKRLEREAD